MKTVYTCFFYLSRIKIGIVQLLLNSIQKTIQEIALERLEIIVVCSVIIATNISKIEFLLMISPQPKIGIGSSVWTIFFHLHSKIKPMFPSVLGIFLIQDKVVLLVNGHGS